MILGRALKMVWKVWLEKDISKQPPSSHSPDFPLALSSSGLMLILSEDDGMQHYCRLLHSWAWPVSSRVLIMCTYSTVLSLTLSLSPWGPPALDHDPYTWHSKVHTAKENSDWTTCGTFKCPSTPLDIPSLKKQSFFLYFPIRNADNEKCEILSKFSLMLLTFLGIADWVLLIIASPCWMLREN